MAQNPPSITVTPAPDGGNVDMSPKGQDSPHLDSLNPNHSLAGLLITNLKEHRDGKKFLTLSCLRELLSASNVQAHLQRSFQDACGSGYEPRQSMEHYLRLICPGNLIETDPTYLRLLATLILSEKSAEIFKFIDKGFSDRDLPAVPAGGRASSSSKLFDCIRDWEIQERLKHEAFERWQWQMNVPFLSSGRHEEFDCRVILPFVKNQEESDHEGVNTHATDAGGYGEVSYVKIHRGCHDLHNAWGLLPTLEGPFALKRLIGTGKLGDMEKDFRNELAMLKKFDGAVHPHIVTVLMTFKHGDRYHFLFPWAECDLLKYFETRPRPDGSLKRVRWIAEQCLKIMQAVDVIHLPPDDKLMPEGKLFGRHGDIKAENILVFKDKNGEDILVLSDFGLASMHHDSSRSNIPNKGLPATPGFRPPECDMKDGQISRAFDVWTLGCLFLDMLTWLLGGENLRKQFEDKRMTIHITGVETSIYFQILPMENGEYRYSVKKQVKDWFAEMHRHPNCTQFVHDFLNMIEQKMLLVESEGRKRARTRVLLRDLEEFHKKCEGPDCQAYCSDRTPSLNWLSEEPEYVQRRPSALVETAVSQIRTSQAITAQSEC